MSEQHVPEPASDASNPQEMAAALFAQLVLQQTNMAMMMLGKIAHPESGQVYKDIEGARLFIDQLEMLETKTKGNLSKEETAFLKQSLMNLRLAFVEAVESSETQKTTESKTVTEPNPAATPATSSSASAEDEHRKKFSKKY